MLSISRMQRASKIALANAVPHYTLARIIETDSLGEWPSLVSSETVTEPTVFRDQERVKGKG